MREIEAVTTVSKYGLLAQDAVYFYTCREIYATIMETADFCETLITKKQRVTS
jgi:hypothetical protein